ncbi:hypothetical protein FKM82_019674 [Ascaphus truei]
MLWLAFSDSMALLSISVRLYVCFLTLSRMVVLALCLKLSMYRSNVGLRPVCGIQFDFCFSLLMCSGSHSAVLA